MHKQGMENLNSFGKSDCVATEIIHCVIATEEDVTCTGYPLALATHAVLPFHRRSPTIQIVLPSGKTMSIAVKADKHVPWTFKM